jgi:predicted aspartyl protease
MALRPIVCLWLVNLIAMAGLAGEPYAEVPFEFLHNQIVLPVKVNGQGPYTFVLDTGTYATSIDAALAMRLMLPLSEAESEGSGAGSRRVFARRTMIGIEVGSLSVKQLPAMALDLSNVSRALGRPLHGVLGFGFLSPRVTQIDYFRRRVRFGAQPSGATRTISFPMQFRTGSVLPVLEDCYVNGIRIPVTIDTGSSAGLILFPKAIDLLGLGELAKQGIPLDAAGYRGKAHLTKGWVSSVVLGSIDLGAIEVAYVQKGYGDNEVLERRGGNLGNAILQDFLLTLDYPNRVVVLESVEQ